MTRNLIFLSGRRKTEAGRTLNLKFFTLSGPSGKKGAVEAHSNDKMLNLPIPKFRQASLKNVEPLKPKT